MRHSELNYRSTLSAKNGRALVFFCAIFRQKEPLKYPGSLPIVQVWENGGWQPQMAKGKTW
jgi:hypothetical protein